MTAGHGSLLELSFENSHSPDSVEKRKYLPLLSQSLTVLRSDMHFVCVLNQHNMLLFLEMDDIHSLVG